MYLQQQIDYLKSENVDTTGKILILQKRLEELELQIGHKKKMKNVYGQSNKGGF